MTLNNDEVASLRKMLNANRHLSVSQQSQEQQITFTICYKSGEPADKRVIEYTLEKSWRDFTVEFGDALKALPSVS